MLKGLLPLSTCFDVVERSDSLLAALREVIDNQVDFLIRASVCVRGLQVIVLLLASSVLLKVFVLFICLAFVMAIEMRIILTLCQFVAVISSLFVAKSAEKG